MELKKEETGRITTEDEFLQALGRGDVVDDLTMSRLKDHDGMIKSYVIPVPAELGSFEVSIFLRYVDQLVKQQQVKELDGSYRMYVEFSPKAMLPSYDDDDTKTLIRTCVETVGVTCQRANCKIKPNPLVSFYSFMPSLCGVTMTKMRWKDRMVLITFYVHLHKGKRRVDFEVSECRNLPQLPQQLDEAKASYDAVKTGYSMDSFKL